MIRFKCIYCGQRILAREDRRGKKGKCPKCSHLLVVPWTTKGRPAISVEKTEPLQRPKDAAARWDPAFTMTHNLPEFSGDDLEANIDELAELYREKGGWFIPTYDELSLFLMAATLILLWITNSKMRNDVLGFTMWNIDNPRLCIFAIVLLAVAGMFLCLYHIFTSRIKTDIEKQLMMCFAVTINATTGIVSGAHTIKESVGWLLVFPIWNIINGILLFLMLRFKIIDEECISDREATLVQIILGLTAVLVIFIFCNYVFKLYWAITFSICIVYTTSFDRALQNVFPGLMSEQTEQPK